ncbi:MAG: hypothetical protein AB1689_23235 [Thermodesulfobacteriota bacterium]
MAAQAQPGFRRLVIALGASRDSLARLELWADLASRLGADLSGLFVEDADLLRMAALPFATVVGTDSVPRALDMPTLERLLRRAAAEARAALEAHAARRAVRWSFESIRAGAAGEVVGSVGSEDLVIVEAAAFGPTSRAALLGCTASVLYLRPQAPLARRVLVAVRGDGGAEDEALLATAAHLAAASGAVLSVLVPEGDGARERAVREALARVLGTETGLEVEVLRGDAARLERLLEEERGAVLVSAEELGPGRAEVGVALEEMACSVLLVRRGARGEA